MKLMTMLAILFATMTFAQCPPLVLPFEEEFETSELDSCWSWIREDSTHWSLAERPGWMRIVTQIGDIGLDGRNELLRPRPLSNYRLETKVAINSTQQHQQAGLLIYLDDNNWLGFIRGNIGGPRLGVHGERNGVYELEGIALTEADTLLWLRISVSDSVATEDWSRDGLTWQRHGSHIYPHIANPLSRIGIYSDNGNTVVPEIPADFDYFRVGIVSQLSVFPTSLEWGAQDIGGEYPMNISITNITNVPAPITALYVSGGTFTFDSTGLNGTIAPLSTFILPVSFIPTAVGFFTDTLTIVSQSENMDTIRVALSGQGAVIPQAVDDLVIKKGSLNGAQLNWDAVTQTLSGQPVTPDYYLVHGATAPSGPFTPFGVALTNNYLHPFITQSQLKYFYRVSSVKE